LIMAVGRLWDQAKNFAILDRIAPRLPWPVFIAGNSSHPEGSQKLFSNLNYLGNLAPALLAQYLGTASIYAAPALYEPFGLSILEGALCGCALVLGDLPSLRELWEGAALFADPRDPEAVAKAIGTLIENEGLRRDLGEQALARAQCYSSQAMGEGYLAIYRSLYLDLASRIPRLGEDHARAKPELPV
jgi:glycosyltransferase involved in cell wall biosynthesis